jgi:hypothetical protein
MFRLGMLRAPEGDGGGAGGAGDGGDGGAAKPITLDDVNKAITGRFADFAKKQETSLKATMTTTLESLMGTLDKALDTKLEAFKSTLPTPSDKDGAGGDKGGSRQTPVTETPEYRGLKKQLDETAAQVRASADREKAAMEAAKATRLRQGVAEMLTKKGFDPARVRLAVGHLIDVDKRVRLDGEGENERIVIKDTDGDVDLETGVDAWAKTDEAKIYLPPRGSAGSGDRGGGRRANGAGQKTEPTFQDLGEFVSGAFPSMTSGRAR